MAHHVLSARGVRGRDDQRDGEERMDEPCGHGRAPVVSGSAAGGGLTSHARLAAIDANASKATAICRI